MFTRILAKTGILTTLCMYPSVEALSETLLSLSLSLHVCASVCAAAEERCTRASLHSDTVEDLIRISVEGQVWKILMLERVWPAGLAEAKDQEGQTTGVGHPRGM